MDRQHTYFVHLIENGGCSCVRDIPLGVYEANSPEAAEAQARREWSLRDADLQVVPMGHGMTPLDPPRPPGPGGQP